jgi:hypothetical protein
VPLHWAQHIRSYPSLHIGEEEGAQAIKELSKREKATLFFGLAMTAVFVGMLILNAIS